MASAGVLPLWGTVKAGWKATWRAMLAMPAVMLVALIATVLLVLLNGALINTTGSPPAKTLSSVIQSAGLLVISNIVFAPAGVALHRFILTDDRTDSYFRDLGHPRMWSFALVTMMLDLVFSLPSLVDSLGNRSSLVLFLSSVLGLIIFFFAVRLSLMPPMAALDADPFSRLREAFGYTRGYFWKIVAIYFVGVFLPTLLAIVPIVALATTLPNQGLVTAPVYAILGFFLWSIGVALISVVFARLVENRPA